MFVTVLVSTICNGILVSCVSVRGTNVLIKKKKMTIEMSCPWISNREKMSEEKVMKYGPLR